ncbi:18460_t:CDS:2 [Funneliformis geosporum]|nr:18460_t:CDS:2 [Funneliformis geosporum]
MNYDFKSSTSYVLPSSKAEMDTGHDLGVHSTNGGEERVNPNSLPRFYFTVQENSRVLPKENQRRASKNEYTYKRTDSFVNYNSLGRVMLPDIATSASSAPISVGNMDKNSTSTQHYKPSKESEHFLDYSSKDHKSLLWGIGNSSRQRKQKGLGQSSTDQRSPTLPTKSKWANNSEYRGIGPMDTLVLPVIKYSDQNANDRRKNKKKDTTLSKLQVLPDYLQDQLKNNNRLGYHQITNKDSLDFVDAEFIEFLAEVFNITGVQPVFIDHSGNVILILDKNGCMYQWDDMSTNLRYLGNSLTEGLTNYFIYPDNVCEVMENTGERIPVKEFEHYMNEKFKSFSDDKQVFVYEEFEKDANKYMIFAIKVTINKYATSEIGCNSSDLMELRAKRRQQQIKLAHEQNLTQENIEDSEREQRANMLIKDLFGK